MHLGVFASKLRERARNVEDIILSRFCEMHTNSYYYDIRILISSQWFTPKFVNMHAIVTIRCLKCNTFSKSVKCTDLANTLHSPIKFEKCSQRQNFRISS